MAKPKHRATVYTVVRTVGDVDPSVIGVYLTPDRADEVKGASEQDMIDRGMGDLFKFEVQATTYYDE